ncbi:hypothetical protein E0Z10_g8227 [Xylaria hypoxylon]|uniref:Uncharacterized protein n=1 Tax=Xylaria hypoxylon TaxID=37992 RepID=A0A4Z0YN47_9PEZI|nr:hypothetical protein E0Z10_g8227 [Xylaria hypoxylon]
MNWTEGSLARHSRGRQRNALIARQKQHFAKARSYLLNGHPKKGPVSISFLSSKSTPESPRRLSHRSHDNRPSTPLQLSDRESQREHPIHRRDDGREALPINLDQRKRLLEKSDWAGLRLQEPLDISFPGQIYATKRWARAAHPRERAPSETRKYTAADGEERYKRLRRSSMRIHIGSQEIQPSVATGSQLGIKPCALEPEKSANTSQQNSISDDSQGLLSSECGRYGYRSRASDGSSRTLPTCFGRPETPVKVAYASSAIHEPVPRRTTTFQVLKWPSSSSEDGGSMQVEIERPERPVPPSQESEQKRWKDWILCEESSNLPSYSPVVRTGTSEVATKGSETSAITLPSNLQPRLPSLRLSSEPDLEPRHTPRYSPTHTDIKGITRNYSIFQDDQCPPGNHNLLPLNHQCISPKKSDVPDDLNDIWRIFACGDDEDSEKLIKDAFKEAAHQAAVELRPSDTSSSADECTGTVATCGTELSSLDRRGKYDSVPSDTSSVSHIATKGTAVLETTLSNIVTVTSSDEPPHTTKRFTLPKAFVGNHVNTTQASIAQAFIANIPRSDKKGKGKRRKKMATDGRTDIRSLPDFDGDPIEEIEDDSFP